MLDGLDLTVSVPADEWAMCRRRLVYLETLLLQIVRERAAIQEWYEAEELAALNLPGMPTSAAGIARKAKAGHWHRRRLGANGRGRIVYHVSSLPGRAFDALIADLLDLPAPDAPPERLPMMPAPSIEPPIALPENAAPAWVLPLMRLVRADPEADIARAWAALPEYLPPGVAMPDVREAAGVLVKLGIA